MNQIDNVHVFSSDVYSNVTETQYAAVITNPPIRAGKMVVHSILSEAKQHLMTAGVLFAVIQKSKGHHLPRPRWKKSLVIVK